MFIIADIRNGVVGVIYLREVEITVIIKLSYRLHQKGRLPRGEGRYFQSREFQLDGSCLWGIVKADTFRTKWIFREFNSTFL